MMLNRLEFHNQLQESSLFRLLYGAASISAGVLLGREIYKIGLSQFYTQARQNFLLQVPFHATVIISLALTTYVIASHLFSDEILTSNWVIWPQSLAAMTISVLSFEALAQAATEGYQLPAYLIAAITANFAGLLILGGMGCFLNIWKNFNDAKEENLVEVI